MSEAEETHYFSLLKSKQAGKVITNLAEYLLMTQAMKGEIKVSPRPSSPRLLHLLSHLLSPQLLSHLRGSLCSLDSRLCRSPPC